MKSRRDSDIQELFLRCKSDALEHILLIKKKLAKCVYIYFFLKDLFKNFQFVFSHFRKTFEAISGTDPVLLILQLRKTK